MKISLKRVVALERKITHEANNWKLDFISILPGFEKKYWVQITEWDGVEMSLAKDIEKYGEGHHYFSEEFDTIEEAENYINDYIARYEARTGREVEEIPLLNACWGISPQNEP